MKPQIEDIEDEDDWVTKNYISHGSACNVSGNIHDLPGSAFIDSFFLQSANSPETKSEVFSKNTKEIEGNSNMPVSNKESGSSSLDESYSLLNLSSGSTDEKDSAELNDTDFSITSTEKQKEGEKTFGMDIIDLGDKFEAQTYNTENISADENMGNHCIKNKSREECDSSTKISVLNINLASKLEKS